MRILHSRLALVLMALLLAFGLSASAQGIQDPTTWKFSIAPQKDGSYMLKAEVQIAAKWHIYAMEPGGEGELIGTSFKMDAGAASLVGKMKELTPAKHEVMMDEHVSVYAGEASFAGKLSGKRGQKISGSVEYQACNDMMCLPPKTKSFTLTLP